MDGMQTSTVSGLVERGQRAREDLEDAQRELMRALDALDVIPGHPEAVSYTHLTLPTIYSV